IQRPHCPRRPELSVRGAMMRCSSRLLIAAVLCTAPISIASAADLPLKAPPITAPAPSWTGFYVGANIGGGWGRRSVDYTPNDPATVFLFDPVSGLGGAPPATSFTSSGVLGGLQVGYNWQCDSNWLIGLETDFNWSGVSGSRSQAFELRPDPDVAVENASVDERIKWFGTVRARLGYLPTDNLLAYVTAGFAYGRVEHGASYININPNTGTLSFAAGGFGARCFVGETCFTGASRSVSTGWTLGGGLEYALSRNVTIKAEYLYVNLKSNPVTETALRLGGPSTKLASFNANFSRTSLSVARLGLNWRF
ncbi:MAG TPA: outer membrane protein, partial [Pseudolabrys sp.]|nr:outer membrane protein [Pseudolabrys sp.]